MEEETVEDEEETEPEITVEEETSEEETREDTEESKVSGEEKKVDIFKREMHKAVCADCGKECEVPFKPIEGKSVYCRDCYRKHVPQRRRF